MNITHTVETSAVLYHNDRTNSNYTMVQIFRQYLVQNPHIIPC